MEWAFGGTHDLLRTVYLTYCGAKHGAKHRVNCKHMWVKENGKKRRRERKGYDRRKRRERRGKEGT